MNDPLDDELDRLVAALAGLGKLRVVCGPQHPQTPQPDLAAPVADFLASHPHMARDAGYVRFLQRMGGLVLRRPGAWFRFTIYGFDPDEWPYLPEKHEVLADSPGFDAFAHIHYKIAPEAPGPQPLAFAFSQAQAGVFRAEGEEAYAWYCDSFIAWLQRAVDDKLFLPQARG